jgi:hypothetical protein
MKKLLTLVAVLAVSIPLMAPRAEAQISFMPYLGYDLDAESLLIGVGAEFGFLQLETLALNIRPSAEYFFIGDSGIEGLSTTFMQFNGDVTAELPVGGPGLAVFAGAGLALRYASVEFMNQSESDTSFGVNILGGVEFGGGFVTPFAQGRLTLGDGSSAFAILGGVKLAL